MFMIFRRNTHKTTAIRGALAFFCLGIALLILAGNAGMASAQEKIEKSAEKSVKSSKIPNFFSSWSLKGKSKEKKEKAVETKKPAVKKPVAETSATEMPTKTPAPTVPNETEVSTVAPLPPEIDYSKVTATSMRTEMPKAEKPAEPANGESNTQKHEEPATTSLASYSFDSRDWVEYFPVDNLPENLSGAPSQTPAAADPFSSAQTTPVRKSPPVANSAPVQAPVRHSVGPATSPSAAPIASAPAKKPNFSDEWNGVTMPITAPPMAASPVTTPPVTTPKSGVAKDGGIRIASSKPSEVRIVKEAPKNALPPKLDLTPSYASQLKYTEVCGVVVVQSNFPLTEIRAILEEIKLLQRDLNLYMGVPAPREKIELCLFRNETTYVDFLQEVFPKAPRDRRALYIKLDNKPGTLLVQKTKEFEVDLRHEMTHAIIHASIRDVPIWLDEGLAKYFEVPIEDRAENNPYMKQIRWNVRFGSVPPLDRLEKLEYIDQMGNREYRDSWAWVHFMIHHSPQSHRLLAGYLQMLATLPEPDSEKDKVRIPPLSPYIKDLIGNPRSSYRKHFRLPDEDPESEEY